MISLNTTKFDTTPRRKVPEEIAHHIRIQIIDGTLPNGSKLPSEQDLASTLCVSRQSLREGLRILESQGLLQIKPGLNGGAFITEAGEESACMSLINFLYNKQLTFKHLAEIRKLIEPYIIKEAIKNITDSQIKELEDILQKSHSEINESGTTKIRTLEIAFHNKLAQIAGNPLLAFINAFIGHLLIGLKNQLKPDKYFSQSVADMHHDILLALKDKDESKAILAVIKDIEIVMSNLECLAENQGYLDWKLIV